MRGLFTALGLSLLLGACGFRPMMATQSNQPEVNDRLGQVKISVIKDRAGQLLRNKLIDRFYHDERPVAPEYQLDVALEAGEEALAVQKDATVSRGQWTVTGNFRLVHIASGQVLMTGSSRAVPGYNSTFVQYASFVSQESAFERGIEYLADEIKTRVSLYFARDPDQRPKIQVTGPAKALEAVPLPGAPVTGWKRLDETVSPAGTTPEGYIK